MDKIEQPYLLNNSSAYMRFKLRVLLKRQLRRERRFQKHLENLKHLIEKYVSGADSREKLLNTLNACLRVSEFHVNALKDLISELHDSPRFIEGNDESVRMMTQSPADVSGQARQPRLALQAGEDGLYPRKVVKNE